jgi:hypothetical protein
MGEGNGIIEDEKGLMKVTKGLIDFGDTGKDEGIIGVDDPSMVEEEEGQSEPILFIKTLAQAEERVIIRLRIPANRLPEEHQTARIFRKHQAFVSR